MEKFVHRLSFLISVALVYVFGAYTYLSFKGFVYENGEFVLVKKANAGFFDNLKQNDDVDEVPAPFAEAVQPHLALNLPQNFITGDDDAPLSIYEFSSLGCTHCADFHLNLLPKLKEKYIDTGKLKVAFVHFPLDKRSMQAAMLAECFNGQKRADFIKLVFSKQREWVLAAEPTNYLLGYAVKNGLTQNAAERCLKNDAIAKEIIFNRQEAIDKLSIQGTPAFLVKSDDKSEIIYGISNINELKGYLDKRLSDFSDEEEE